MTTMPVDPFIEVAIRETVASHNFEHVPAERFAAYPGLVAQLLIGHGRFQVSVRDDMTWERAEGLRKYVADILVSLVETDDPERLGFERVDVPGWQWILPINGAFE